MGIGVWGKLGTGDGVMEEVKDGGYGYYRGEGWGNRDIIEGRDGG